MRTGYTTARRLICLWPLLFLLLSAAPAFGASISGKVVRESDANAIPGAGVRLYDANWRFVAVGTCDETGTYVLDHLPDGAPLPAGRYFVQTSNDRNYIDEYYDKAAIRSSATPVEVKPGSRVDGIDFSLNTWGSISGRVVSNSDKTGLSGIRVIVFDEEWTWVASTYTDAGGTYTVKPLKPALYFLATRNDRGFLDEYYDNIQALGASRPPEGVKPLLLPKDSVLVDINFGLDMGGLIFGRVTRESDGTPLRDVSVDVIKEDQSAFYSTRSGDDGKYVLQGLPTGRFYLRTTNTQGYIDVYFENASDAKNAALIPIKAGERKSIDFKLAAGGSVSGRVVEGTSGQPMPEVEIRLYDSRWGLEKEGFSEMEGIFSIAGLPAGAYFLRTLSPGDHIDEWYDHVTDSSRATPIAVEKGVDTRIKDLSLTMGGAISGRVLCGPEGKWQQEVYVKVYDQEGTLVAGAPTDPAGRYVVRKVPPGSYFVQTSNAQGCKDLFYDGAAGRPDATRVTVTSGRETRNIDFILTP